MTTRTPASLLLAAAAALGGCGASTKTVTVGGPPPSLGSASAQRSSTAATATVPHDRAPALVVHLNSFQSPTGNIGCAIAGGTARCDIVHRTWQPPARPAGCPRLVDYGQGLLVTPSGGAAVVCAGDTVRDPRAPQLAYGSASRLEGAECVSRPTGMTCTEGATGHGFFISAQSYRLF